MNPKNLKKIARLQRLEHEAKVGRPRAKSWGGPAGAKEDRRKAKRDLRRNNDD